MKRKWEAILWDFDGVILDSAKVRDKGFEMVLKEYPPGQVEELMAFHRANGGLSRYVKFRYFFEEIRNQRISERELKQWAERFSVIMKKRLTDRSLLMDETVSYIRKNYLQKPMHIVSGSDQSELRFLCNELNISEYFRSIHGSPVAKKDLVARVLTENSYDSSDCILIGDSINDYDAAVENSVNFAGYNNKELMDFGDIYIADFINL